MKSAVLGGGCFWCVEAGFNRIEGVIRATSGYMGGKASTANYRDVCTKGTEHVEVVKVDYDENKISYEEILEIFFTLHDPTTLNRQGNDVGPQYRSVIFTANPEEAATARRVIERLQPAFDRPIVTAIEPAKEFYPAETEHQGYYDRVGSANGYCTVVIDPKIAKLRKKYANRLKAGA